MKRLDQSSSLFWLVLSIFTCIESFRLGIGTPRQPGMGFMAFGASTLLGILSLTLFFKSMLKKEEIRAEPLFAGRLWKRVLLTVIALMIYSNVLTEIGYLMGTFLLMNFVFWMAQVKGWKGLVSSFITTVATYYVFSVWLGCQFPKGFLGI